MFSSELHVKCMKGNPKNTLLIRFSTHENQYIFVVMANKHNALSLRGWQSIKMCNQWADSGKNCCKESWKATALIAKSVYAIN